MPTSPTLTYYTTGQFMELDLTARRNLELTETLRSKEKKGTLLWVLDKTSTAMGHRLLRGVDGAAPALPGGHRAAAWRRWRNWWATPSAGRS